MKMLLMLSFVLHFLALGTWVGLRDDRLEASLILKILAYLFVFHLLAGYLLKAYPALFDPRETARAMAPLDG